MKSMGQQFVDIMQPRVSSDTFSEAGYEIAKRSEESARERSSRGEPLPNGLYDNNYVPRVAKQKGRVSPVTLRETGASMRGMSTQKSERGGEVKGSRKLHWHDTGTAKGGKTRQLFPTRLNQFPGDERAKLFQTVKAILSGQQSN